MCSLSKETGRYERERRFRGKAKGEAKDGKTATGDIGRDKDGEMNADIIEGIVMDMLS